LVWGVCRRLRVLRRRSWCGRCAKATREGDAHFRDLHGGHHLCAGHVYQREHAGPIPSPQQRGAGKAQDAYAGQP
jgi:hypothetical protein